MYVVTPTIPRFNKLLKTILNNSYNNKGYGFRNTTLNWLYSIIEIFYKDLIPPTHTKTNTHKLIHTYIFNHLHIHIHVNIITAPTTSTRVHTPTMFTVPSTFSYHANTPTATQTYIETHIYMSDWINVSVWCMSMSINYCINILM